jgi:tetratricopeptide (TPR) repeat protein
MPSLLDRLSAPLIAPRVRGRGCRLERQGFACGLLLTAVTSLAAQHEGHHRRDTTSVGVVSFANSGAAAAQPAFRRGLALLHNFEYPEAATAFREAERIDSSFAMAYWGEAMTYNHGIWRQQDSVKARAIVARLATIPPGTQRERDYIHTLDVLYGEGTKSGRDTAYAVTMAELAKRYPDDIDAQLFSALALLSLTPRTDSTYEHAGAIAGRVLRDHPEHPGALHYLIHAYDDPAHARQGLAAARSYGKVAPGAEHAMHMTSHIFIALGLWDDVVAANEAADPDARKFGKGAAPSCGHYGIWLQYAYLQQGRLAEARRMMEACHANRGQSADDAFGFAQMRLSYLIDTDDPGREAPSAAAVAVLTAADAEPSPMRAAGEGQALAYRALRHGDTLLADAPLARIRELRAMFDSTPMRRLNPEMVGAWAVTEHELEALRLLRRGQTDDAITLLRRSAIEEDALPFAFGPPQVDKPSHELLGEVLLSLGRAAEARKEFELALARTPGRSLVLLGLARASLAAGDRTKAAASYRRLLANWHRADPGLAWVEEARQGAH